MPRLYITLTNQEMDALNEKCVPLGFSPSQYGRYVILGDLKLSTGVNIPPLQYLKPQLRNYILGLDPNDNEHNTFIVSSAFPQWWSFDTSTKRTLASYLSALEASGGLCKKTGETTSNGTNIYRRI